MHTDTEYEWASVRIIYIIIIYRVRFNSRSHHYYDSKKKHSNNDIILVY